MPQVWFCWMTVPFPAYVVMIPAAETCGERRVETRIGLPLLQNNLPPSRPTCLANRIVPRIGNKNAALAIQGNACRVVEFGCRRTGAAGPVMLKDTSIPAQEAQTHQLRRWQVGRRRCSLCRLRFGRPRS